MAEDHAILLGRIDGRLDGIEARLEEIDTRLDAGDKRFETIATTAAASSVERKIAMKVGSWVLGLAVSTGGAALAALIAHAPAIAAWLVPPKH